MVGQIYIKRFMDTLIARDCLPRFILLIGPLGSGKKTLADYIVSEIKANHYIVPDVKIATIRDVIADAYKQKTEMLYVVPDIDNMSVEAQNAILKITEEPPNKAYFIMTVTDVNNILPTIKSRAYPVCLDVYKPEEIREYAQSTGKLSDVAIDTMVLEVCETPGEVNTFIECGAEKFYDYVDKVVENVDNVTIANLLKTLNSLDITGNGNGYDVNLYLKVFMRCCIIKGCSSTYDARVAYQYIRMIPPTSKALIRLHVKGANRNMILTDWLFEVRS